MTIALAGIQNVLNQIFAPVVADQLNNRVEILRRVRKTIGSGKNIAWGAKVASSHVAGSYADGATINSGASATTTRVPAILQWKLNKAEFSASGLAIATAANNGPEALANLLGEEIRSASRDLAVAMATQMYADGTGNSNLDLDGLGVICKNTGSYATIARSGGGSYSVWQGNYYANSGTPRTLTKAIMDTAERDVFIASGGTVDLIITTPALVTTYEWLFDSIKRQDTNAASYEIGSRSVTYKGIPVLRDARCPAGTMFMLSYDCLRFEQLPPLGMADGMQLVQGYAPIMDPDGNVGLQVGIELLGKTGDKIDGFLKVYGNMVCTQPNMCAMIVDLQ